MPDWENYLTSDEATILSVLPLHARSTIAALRDGGSSYEDIVEDWLSPPGAGQLAPFGSLGFNSFAAAFQAEIRKFICGSSEYATERENLSKQLSSMTGGVEAIQALIVASITSVIAPVVGASAVLLAPAVALSLIMVAKMTKNAWCTMAESQKD